MENYTAPLRYVAFSRMKRARITSALVAIKRFPSAWAIVLRFHEMHQTYADIGIMPAGLDASLKSVKSKEVLEYFKLRTENGGHIESKL